MYKGYKIRLYPTKEQEELFWKHIHASRFIYNYMLEVQNKRYDNNEKYLQRFNMIKLLPQIKKLEQYNWLNEVSSHTLSKVCDFVHNAFVLYFKKVSKRPKFKSRKVVRSKFPVRDEALYFYKPDVVNIEKCGKVKCKTEYSFLLGKGSIKVCHSSIEYINNKWILSFAMECDKQAQELNDFSMGIDLGIKELAVISYDNKIEHFHNINKSKKMRNLEKRRKHYQRVMSHKLCSNGNIKSNNYNKYRINAKKLYYKQRCIRDNYIHQVTRYLVNLLPCRVVVEDLQVRDLIERSCKNESRTLQEQKLAYFISVLQYKCERAGIEFIQADRFYPSSKTCSCCGNVKKDLKLSDRVYRCEKCGFTIDRDENAAKNLEKYIA